MTDAEHRAQPSDWGIWGLAFGYFACYVPYSALTKAISSGLFPSVPHGISGVALLPISVMASLVSTTIFLSAMRWWKHATQWRLGSWSLPRPTLWTGLSGLCTAAILLTTTLAYTFDGVSIVFVMLLMRGGVLVIAPVGDAVTGRKTRWFSWVGLLLSLAALVVAFSENGGYTITLLCAIDVALYLASYFVRLRLMTRLAKAEDPSVSRRYFVEEQLVATPASVALLVALALIDRGALAHEVRVGFTDVFASPVVLEIVFLGVMSQGTGIFGGLVFLDKRENTFTVPVNRAASILAGVLASFTLALLAAAHAPSAFELAGAALVVVAIVFLSVPPALEKRRLAAARAAAAGAAAP